MNLNSLANSIACSLQGAASLQALRGPARILTRTVSRTVEPSFLKTFWAAQTNNDEEKKQHRVQRSPCVAPFPRPCLSATKKFLKMNLFQLGQIAVMLQLNLVCQLSFSNCLCWQQISNKHSESVTNGENNYWDMNDYKVWPSNSFLY